MAEKHVHKVYGSFPPWGKSVEFPAGGGASGGGNYVYYSGTTRDFAEDVAMASIIKANMDGDIVFMPSGRFWTPDANNENIIGAGFDTSMKMTSFDDSSELITVGDIIAEPSKNWTRITEEEFYDPKIPMGIDFRGWPAPDGTNLNVVNFNYDKGMTWREWLSSPYNTLAETGFPLSFKEEEGYEPYLGGFTEQGMPYYLNSPADERYVLADDIIFDQVYQIHILG